jgi:hypothetical protein
MRQDVEPIILSVDEAAEVSIRDVAMMVAEAMGMADRIQVWGLLFYPHT